MSRPVLRLLPVLRREFGLVLTSLSVAGCAVAALLLAGCKEKPSEPVVTVKPAAATCPIASKVDHDVTLTKACSPYNQPRGGIDVVNGATLTIEAGVELRIFGLDWLEVGAGGEPGRMIAKGTAEEPIVFTFADAAEPKKWLGLWFHSGTLPGSELSHAVLRGGGGDNRHSKPNLLMGCLTLTGVKPGALRIDGVTVEGCVNGGLRMTNSHVQLGAFSFVDTSQGFVVDPESAGQITQPAQYRGVTENVIRGGTLAADARWLPQAVPYVVDGDISVGGPSSPKLTLAAGTELRFTKGHGLLVGAEQPGALLVEGTEEAPVKLGAKTSGEPWSGVRLQDQTQSGTRLSYAQVTDSAGEGGVTVSAKAGHVEIQNSSFSGNTTDVLLGCGAQLESGSSNKFASQRGLVREPCSSAKKR
jgi:hypothetical protein